MSTFLQVLRLVFWTNPLQRALTCLGVILVVADSIVGLLNSNRLSLSLGGLIYPAMANLLMSGVYWRIVSAPRIVRLAPRGRTRLLGSVAGLVLLIPLLLALATWLDYLRWVDPEYMPSMTRHLVELAGSVLLTSVAVVGLFIASRSPFAALVVLVVVVSPGIAATLFDMDDVDLSRKLSPLRTVTALLALIWIPFSSWYLTARRISRPRWLASGGQDVLATAMVSWARPKSRREAQERQLLGGTTVMWLALQWFLVLGLLLGLQWVLAQMGYPRDPELMARVMYASLGICPVVTTIVSFAAIRRSRSLWLLTGSSRAEFFACVELVLRRMQLAMVLVFVIWLAVLWFAQSWRPDAAMDQLALANFHCLQLWALGWFAVNAQLARLSKWPIAILAAAALPVLWWLAATSGTGGVLISVLLPIGLLIAGVALLALARHRWRDGDFPRKAIGQT